jgi:ABC-type uncharacterized transport system fused permease/ATPase subunit
MVPQRVHLFSATLRDNLLLAAPQASDEVLTEVLNRTGLEKLLDDSGLNAGWVKAVVNCPAANFAVWLSHGRYYTMRRWSAG